MNGITAGGCKHLKEGRWDLEELKMSSGFSFEKTNCSHIGSVDNSHIGKLIYLAFGFPKSKSSFVRFIQIKILLAAWVASSWLSLRGGESSQSRVN